jgi:hypothetical protein
MTVPAPSSFSVIIESASAVFRCLADGPCDRRANDALFDRAR